MNKWTELLFGLVLIIAPIILWNLTLGVGFWDFGTAAWDFFKGGLVWFIIMLGILFVLLGISDLKG